MTKKPQRAILKTSSGRVIANIARCGHCGVIYDSSNLKEGSNMTCPTCGVEVYGDGK